MAEAPQWSPDGKPLNAAARKALNTAIKHSAQGTQDKLKTLGISKTSGKTRIGNLSRGGLGGILGKMVR